MTRIENWETIVELEGESDSGTIKLYRKKLITDEWVFSTNKGVEIASQNFKEVFTNLRALWNHVHPTYIHPFFSDQVWAEITQTVYEKDRLLQWAQPCFPEVFKVAQYILTSSKTVVFTGAGMSTESGVPDFRSQSGLWKEIDPKTVATVEVLNQNYPLFQEFYSTRIKGLKDVKAHDGHKIIAEWEKKGLVQLVATQNVDGLHQQAGSQKVEELHGSISTIKCQQCQQKGTIAQFLAIEVCSHCGGKLRPSVVLFNEALPEAAWKHSFETIKKADVVIVIGTSLEVYPANELPFLTGGKTILINLEEVESEFDVIVTGKAKDTLQKLNELLVLLER